MTPIDIDVGLTPEAQAIRDLGRQRDVRGRRVALGRVARGVGSFARVARVEEREVRGRLVARGGSSGNGDGDNDGDSATPAIHDWP